MASLFKKVLKSGKFASSHKDLHVPPVFEKGRERGRRKWSPIFCLTIRYTNSKSHPTQLMVCAISVILHRAKP